MAGEDHLTDIGHHLRSVGVLSSLGFAGLMLLGLWIYTFTLTAAWPGISHTKAAIVNVTGSAVANTMPGAAPPRSPRVG